MVVADAGLLENRRAPATTLEGWRSFISADPSELALLPAGQWEALGERDRRDYDEARIAHHAELVVVTTSAIAEITGEGQLLVLMNQREIGARRGLIVSGDAATGKTTASSSSAACTSCGSGPGSRPGPTGSRSSTSPARPRARRASWPWSSPGSSACRCGPGPTSPTSPTRSARSSSTPAPTWSWSILPTVVTAVLDVRPACVPGRSVIIYRLGPDRPSCSQASVWRACGSAGCDRSAQGSEADEEGRPSVVDDRVAGGEGARRGGPVPAPS